MMRRWLILLVCLPLLLALVLVMVLATGAYAFFPQLVSWLAPSVATEWSLTELRLTADRPGLNGIMIHDLRLVAGGVVLTGEDLEIGYRPVALLSGNLDTLVVRQLDVEVAPLSEDAPATTPEPTPGVTPLAAVDAPAIEAAFGRVPFERVDVESLTLNVPQLKFQAAGNLQVDDLHLEVILEALTPREAEGLRLDTRLSRTGEISAEVTSSDPESASFVSVRSAVPDNELRMLTDMHLEGFVLQLIQTLTGLPEGKGVLSGTAELSYPWPLGDEFEIETLSAVGALSITWETRAAQLSLAALDGPFSFSNGEFRWSPADRSDALVSWRAGTSQVEFNPRRIEVKILSRQLSADGAIRGVFGQEGQTEKAVEMAGMRPSLSPVTIEGSVDLMLTSADTGSARIEADFDGKLMALGEQFPVQTGLNGELADAFEGEFRVTSGLLRSVPVLVRYPLSGEPVLIETRYRLAFSEPLLAALWPGWEGPYDLESGEIQLTATMQVAADAAISGEVSAMLSKVDGYFSDSAIRGANGLLQANFDDGGLTLLPSEIRIELLDFGVPLTNVSTTLSGNLQRLHVTETSGQVLDGEFELDPFDYLPDEGVANLAVSLEGLSLAALLALEGGDVTGTGIIDGQIPVAIRQDRVNVDGGELQARAPGGNIRLSSVVTGAMTQPGLDIALGALSNFHYETLIVKVNYSESGDLQLGVRLEGSNPEVENGRAIHYNLNVSENIPVLLESLRLQDAFTERIERRVLR